MNKIVCRWCKSENVRFVLTPDKVHFGKYVCLECGKFIQWVSKPKNHKDQSMLAEIFSNHKALTFGHVAEDKVTVWILDEWSSELLAYVELDPVEPGEVVKLEWTVGRLGR